MNDEQLFQCAECSLHYHDEATALACAEFCRQNQACSLEIAKYSVEVEQRKHDEN